MPGEHLDRTYENCYIQSCVAPCDQYENEPFTQSVEFFQKNSEFLDQARSMEDALRGNKPADTLVVDEPALQ